MPKLCTLNFNSARANSKCFESICNLDCGPPIASTFLDEQDVQMSGSVRWLFNSGAWDPSPSLFSFCLSVLPSSLHYEVTRFVRFEDQKRSLVSRLMQYMLVNTLFKIPYEEIVILRTEEGKPYVEPCYLNTSSPNLNFNVSHHGDYVALASETLCLVGLDIMVADSNEHEAPQEYIENFRSCFTTLEWNNIHSVGPDPNALLCQFHRYWCMKESYIKAVGVGLGFELQRAEFFFKDGNVWSDSACLRLDEEERSDWCFRLSHLDNNHWVCVAKGPPADAVESFKKTLHVLDVDVTTLTLALREEANSFTALTIHDIIPHTLRKLL